MSTRMMNKMAKNIDTHDLVKTGDPEARSTDGETFPPFCDRNGEVVLAFCRRCRGGEAELFDEPCLTRLVRKAVEAEAKLPPLERAMNQLRQRRSWVVGEAMMNDDASPNGRTREEAVAFFESIAPEFVLLAELERRNAEERIAADGTTRKAHYGPGRQPWDDIRDAGWGPEFCAGNVLKYLRRSKDLEHSLQSARVYYNWLNGLAVDQRATGRGHAIRVLNQLDAMLTAEERATVHEGLTVR